MRAARRPVQGAVLALSVLLGLLFLVPGGRAAAATYRVAMSGYAFSPATLTVTAGSTVTWTNQDTAPHDVKTSSGPAAFHSPMLNKGGSWSFTFTTPGAYAYYCTVHPNMTARIMVQPAAPATSAAAPTHDHSRAGADSGSQSSGNQTSRSHTAGHHAAAPSPTTATRSPASSPAPSKPSTSAPAAARHASPSPTPTAASMPQTQVTAAAARPLDPLLVLTGIVAGVAVLCLLLVGSRASRTREEVGD
ncbi:cupredoxin domain-containing protein [Streptomyces viridochromogenes]|uniref:cupredoxin domain-containing protein n=1 Tax=Streptomyces viridochromogenes TaxID=1938 RepID=UPI0006C636A8|nr:cupredoxin family copper-binding protein [Streptomyces viridochromogenes]KOG19630.1 copper-binding protein [Streptomyces viridochromogenes]KOG23013.1 copper-binding protein [Streptomyces viridochromogenes]